jgi:hypothetical protein
VGEKRWSQAKQPVSDIPVEVVRVVRCLHEYSDDAWSVGMDVGHDYCSFKVDGVLCLPGC